jgi:hypothetical protein
MCLIVDDEPPCFRGQVGSLQPWNETSIGQLICESMARAVCPGAGSLTNMLCPYHK